MDTLSRNELINYFRRNLFQVSLLLLLCGSGELVDHGVITGDFIRTVDAKDLTKSSNHTSMNFKLKKFLAAINFCTNISVNISSLISVLSLNIVHLSVEALGT